MKIKMAGGDVLVPTIAFAIWTLTSFLCHKSAKVALLTFNAKITSSLPMAAPVIVTLWQITSCYGVLNFSVRRGRLFFVMAVSHVVATLATNTSLALIFASSTMAVKLLEPVTSALMQRVVLGMPMKTESLFSTVMIVVGAVMFVGDPLQDVLLMKGLGMALLSNIILGLRNVAIKLDQSNSGEISFRSFYQIMLYFFGAFSVIGILYVFETSLRIIPSRSTYCVLLCLASGVCHVTYSYVSTNVILRYMSVVGHALANIVKRMLVVLLLHVSGRRLASVWNWAGLGLCALGLFLYNGRRFLSSLTSSSSSLPLSSMAGHTEENRGKSADFTADTRKNTLLYRLLVVCLSLYVLYSLSVEPNAAFSQQTSDYAGDLRHGIVKWRDGHLLLKDNITFQPPLQNKGTLNSFLNTRLTEIGNNTDQLSPYLKTTKEVIDEAQRVQLNLLSNLLQGKKFAVLIGATSFENKGDPAITVGQLRLLEKLQVQLIYYINEEACTNRHYEYAVNIVLRYSSAEVVVLMQGGGNIIGYKGVNRCREKAFTYFPDYQVVLLSQSLYMKGSENWVGKMVDLYCCRPNFTIFLRDRLSFYIARRLFRNKTNLILAPDMAFGIGSVSRFSPPFYDVLWLRRIDMERPCYDDMPTFPSDVTLHVADWWRSKWDTPKGSTTLETAHNVMENGFLFLQRGRVVVTERLHGHILATLLDIPHVILDNKDNKLSSYHNTWTRALSNVRLAQDPKEAMQLALELLKEYESSLPPVFHGMDIKEFRGR